MVLILRVFPEASFEPVGGKGRKLAPLLRSSMHGFSGKTGVSAVPKLHISGCFVRAFAFSSWASNTRRAQTTADANAANNNSTRFGPRFRKTGFLQQDARAQGAETANFPRNFVPGKAPEWRKFCVVFSPQTCPRLLIWGKIDGESAHFRVQIYRKTWLSISATFASYTRAFCGANFAFQTKCTASCFFLPNSNNPAKSRTIDEKSRSSTNSSVRAMFVSRETGYGPWAHVVANLRGCVNDDWLRLASVDYALIKLHHPLWTITKPITFNPNSCLR